MAQKPNRNRNRKFQITTHTSIPTERSATSREFIIASIEQAFLPPSALCGNDSRWKDSEAIAQFQQKLAQAKGEKSSKDRKDASAFHFEIHFTSGSTATFLFLNPTSDTFLLHRTMREAFGELLKNTAVPSPRLALHLLNWDPSRQKEALEAFCFLAATLQWRPDRFGNGAKAEQKSPFQMELLSSLTGADATSIATRAWLKGEANNEVRRLATFPSNLLNPGTYRKIIQNYAREKGLEYEFWDLKELTRRKAGAFLAVSRADPNGEGGIAVIRYRPASTRKKASARKLALVGKGICFDTGGYNIKSAKGMLGMHGDMTGSALALALCGFFADTKADFEVHAFLALAENLISPTAYKPNEVVTASDGTAIEVVDTDAEGRMILSDTLAFARKTRPDLVIDYATLTGAAIRSIGTHRAAIFSNRDELRVLAHECGEKSGERNWTFPIGGDYREGLKSEIADILQCSSSDHADHIYAATFLSHFIGEETPWVHMDLAPSENKGGLGLIATDTTGFGVLWTDHFVQSVFGVE